MHLCLLTLYLDYGILDLFHIHLATVTVNVLMNHTVDDQVTAVLNTAFFFQQRATTTLPSTGTYCNAHDNNNMTKLET